MNRQNNYRGTFSLIILMVFLILSPLYSLTAADLDVYDVQVITSNQTYNTVTVHGLDPFGGNIVGAKLTIANGAELICDRIIIEGNAELNLAPGTKLSIKGIGKSECWGKFNAIGTEQSRIHISYFPNINSNYASFIFSHIWQPITKNNAKLSLQNVTIHNVYLNIHLFYCEPFVNCIFIGDRNKFPIESIKPLIVLKQLDHLIECFKNDPGIDYNEHLELLKPKFFNCIFKDEIGLIDSQEPRGNDEWKYRIVGVELYQTNTDILFEECQFHYLNFGISTSHCKFVEVRNQNAFFESNFGVIDLSSTLYICDNLFDHVESGIKYTKSKPWNNYHNTYNKNRNALVGVQNSCQMLRGNVFTNNDRTIKTEGRKNPPYGLGEFNLAPLVDLIGRDCFFGTIIFGKNVLDYDGSSSIYDESNIHDDIKLENTTVFVKDGRNKFSQSSNYHIRGLLYPIN